MTDRVSMRSRLLVALISGLLPAAGLAHASTQQPPAQASPQKPEVVIPVGTEVVRVDVIVTEKGGKAMAGLKREDFQVLEDGQPQPITSFEAFVAPAVASAAAAAAPRPLPGDPAPPVTQQSSPRRFVVFAVDDIHIEAANLMRLKKTLDRFLERELPPEDVVALVTTSGQHSHDLTDDRHALREVVARLSPRERRLRQIDVPYITEYQAELIERGDPEALQVAVDEILARRRSPNPEGEARAVARSVLAESINNSRITFETLSNVVRGMGGLPGRKTVVLVSDGFTSGFGVEAGAIFDLRRITDAGTRSGVIVYALDSQGLHANSGFSASSRGPVMTIAGGFDQAARERIALAGELAAQDAMNAMAADTGGFLVSDTNNFSSALRKIVQDSETYYVLAYEPTSTKRDGGFRKIEVRLPGFKNARLRHRKGYFGPLPAGPVAGAGEASPATVSPSPMDALRAELRTTLTSLEPLDRQGDAVGRDPRPRPGRADAQQPVPDEKRSSCARSSLASTRCASSPRIPGPR
jgi:VWFA-related protein